MWIDKRKPFLLFTLALFFWAAAFFQGQKILDYENLVEVRFYGGDGVPKEAWDRMVREELKLDPEGFPEAAAWSAERRVKASGVGLSLTQEVLCISVSGNKEQAVRKQLLSGNFGYRDDTWGCVVSRATAWELFGSLDVVGQKIRLKDKTWIIRGVMDSMQPAVIVSDKRLGTEYYTGLSFSYSEREQTAKRTRELLFRYGTAQDGVIIDESLYGAVVRLFLTAPAWVFLCQILKKGRFLKWGEKADKSLCFLFWIMGAMILLRAGFQFPQDFIPTEWSDLGFWSEKYREVMKNGMEILALQKTPWEAERITAFAASLLGSSGAALLAAIGAFFQAKP